MNQITEQLKNEAGLIKVRRLSEKKIQLEYYVPILHNVNGNLIVISNLKIKSRYKILDVLSSPFSTLSSNNIKKAKLDEDKSYKTYIILEMKPNFYRNLSQNWKIKIKFIKTRRNFDLKKISIDGEEVLISNRIDSIIFDNTSWSRDYIIKNILKITKNDTRSS